MLSTAAVVMVISQVFDDVNRDLVIMVIDVKTNGDVAPNVQITIEFARDATQSVKQAAIRNAINAHLGAYEPGAALTNANIQISGLPV